MGVGLEGPWSLVKARQCRAIEENLGMFGPIFVCMDTLRTIWNSRPPIHLRISVEVSSTEDYGLG